MERTLALIACLVLGAVLGWAGERGPRPLPASAPAEAFSARRAAADIAVIARAPHPTGSAANRQVRDHLTARLTALGLAPEIQAARPFTTYGEGEAAVTVGARIENIVAVLPGAERQAPALVLMAHYDSVPGSPGAADDAAGVAAVLEIVRALQAQGTPARDVMVVLTDGEEIGLLGARAFFAGHPLAARAGFVINLEARGSGGRTAMFETGRDGGPTADLFIAAAPGAPANSLAVFAYEQMPNDTDFSIPKAAGLPGLNFAFTGRQFDYHSPTATLETLSLRSVQDMGDQALAAARAVAFSKALPGPGADKVYASVMPGVTLSYPPQAGWGVLAGAALLLALGVWRARRADPPFRLLDAGQGALAGIYILVAGAAVLRFARAASGAGYGYLEQRELLAQAGRFETAVILLGLGVVLLAAAACARGRMRLAAAVLAGGAGVGTQAFTGWDPAAFVLGAAGVALALVAFGRPARRAGAWAGLLATGLVLGAGVQAAAPGAAFLIAWPLVLACAGAAASALGARRPRAVLVLLTLLAALGIGWLAGGLHAVFVGLDTPEILVVFAWLSAFLVWPFAHPAIGGAGRITALLTLATGLAVLALVNIDPPWSERHPRVSLVHYLVDQDQGTGHVLDRAPRLSPWSRRALQAHGEIGPVTATPLFAGPARGAAAPALDLPAPMIELDEGDGRLVLTLAAPGAEGVLAVDLRADAAVEDVRLNGAPAPLLARPGGWSRLRWSADGQPVQISFRPQAPGGTLEVRYAALTPGWPVGARPLPPRPAEVMAFDTSDSTIVRGTRSLSW